MMGFDGFNLREVYKFYFLKCNNVFYPEEPVGVVSLTEPDVRSSGKVHRWQLHNPFINSDNRAQTKIA